MKGYFDIQRILGQGSFGTVFKALDKTHNRTVALKILHPEHAANPKVVQQFFREALVLTRLEHPGIPRVLYLGPFKWRNNEPTYALAQQYFEGQDLAERLEKHGHYTPNQALELLLQLCPILDYAHSRGVVHRDLKPSNIYLTSDGPKILDFGIAKIAWVQAVDTAPGGTLLYAAPEQLGKERHVTERTDIFSLGMLMYEMISGEHPSRLNLGEFFQWVKADSPPPLHSPSAETRDQQILVQQMERVFRRMVVSRPQHRYPTIKAVMRALRQIAEPTHSSSWLKPPEESRLLFGWLDAKRDPHYRRRSNRSVQTGPTLRLFQSPRFRDFFDQYIMFVPDQPEALQQAHQLKYQLNTQGLLRQEGSVKIVPVTMDCPWDVQAVALSLQPHLRAELQSWHSCQSYAYVSSHTSSAQAAWFLLQSMGEWEGTFLQTIPADQLAPGEDPVLEMPLLATDMEATIQ